MELVCFQGLDKESWTQLNALIKKGDWDKVLVVKNKAADSFSMNEKCEVIEVNSESALSMLKEDMAGKLKQKIGNSFEIALTIASGTGKEHMALISALLSIPVGIRLVAFTKNGVEFVN